MPLVSTGGYGQQSARVHADVTPPTERSTCVSENPTCETGVPMGQAIQIVGSLLILTAFGLSQLGWLAQRSLKYLALNAVGALLLAGDAIVERQWGFILLESVWALISLCGFVMSVRAKGRLRH